MSRPNLKLLALVTIAAGLVCASAANAAGSTTHSGGGNIPGAVQSDPAPAPTDPNFAPYPGCQVLLRVKADSCDPDQPVQLDITGEADVDNQIDQVQTALAKESVPDGGLKWEYDRKVLLVRLVGPIDGSSPAAEHAKAAAVAAAKGLTVEFQSVKYSRVELQALADRLLLGQNQQKNGLLA